MQNENGAGEPHSQYAFVEQTALSAIAQFQNDGITLTKDFLLDCCFDFLREGIGSPDMEAKSGMPAEIILTFYNDRRDQFHARFAPCVARAFEAWEAAARANGGVAN